MKDTFTAKDLETVDQINEVAEKFKVSGADVLIEANRLATDQKEDIADGVAEKILTSSQLIEHAGQNVAEVYKKEMDILKEDLSSRAFELHAESYGYQPLEYGDNPVRKEAELLSVQIKEPEISKSGGMEMEM